MVSITIIIRNAVDGDVPQIFDVRTSVRENHLSMEQLARIGVTPQAILEVVHQEPCIWVAMKDDQIIGFSMASAEEACLFALFVRPQWEGQGAGKQLLERAEAFLFSNSPSIWLHTQSASRAARFYEKRGWKKAGLWHEDEYRYEKHRPDWIASKRDSVLPPQI